MSVFVDTSGLYALLNANDQNHTVALTVWRALQSRNEELRTTNYVLLETIALTERRLGLEAVREVVGRLVPLLDTAWVDQPIHDRAVAMLLAANQRDLSLVDCVSFQVMLDQRINEAFAFDGHFSQRGFRRPDGA